MYLELNNSFSAKKKKSDIPKNTQSFSKIGKIFSFNALTTFLVVCQISFLLSVFGIYFAALLRI